MTTFLLAALLSAGAAQLPNDPGPCTVGGNAIAADALRARHACGIARTRFAALFGVDAPALEIVLWDRPGYRVSDVGPAARVYWPTSAAAAAQPVEAHWRDVLPHEAMHALVATHFFADGEELEAAYGTPLPDWFEEAAAIWAEPVANRRQRIAQARNLPAAFLALDGILTTPHPAARNPALLAARDGAALPANDAALWAFYPQAIAVLSFVHDAGGPPAVRRLVARLRATPTSVDVLAGLPGLPANAAEIATAWEKWLAASATSPSLDGS